MHLAYLCYFVFRLPEKFDEGARVLLADPMLATGSVYELLNILVE